MYSVSRNRLAPVCCAVSAASAASTASTVTTAATRPTRTSPSSLALWLAAIEAPRIHGDAVEDKRGWRTSTETTYDHVWPRIWSSLMLLLWVEGHWGQWPAKLDSMASRLSDLYNADFGDFATYSLDLFSFRLSALSSMRTPHRWPENHGESLHSGMHRAPSACAQRALLPQVHSTWPTG